jgi:hypothetical protein
MNNINNSYFVFANCLICYITFFVSYQLALVFVGSSIILRKSLLPVLIASIIGYISKICLEVSASVQIVVVALTCTGLLYLFNRFSFMLSLIGSLFSIVTLAIGSIFFACPLFVALNYQFPPKLGGNSWLFLALLELIVPTIILVLLRINKFSLIKCIHKLIA